ncbi:MAG: hypothetical protein IJ693_03270 [Bacteroidaceae bacterium]|nr:hypothetical protein [Bacteroidaceae bacterium]
MKRLLTLALVIVPLLGMAQDDLYFTSSKKAKEEALKRNQEKQEKWKEAAMKARTETVVSPTTVDYQSNTRSEDEYNRRYVYGGDYQNAGGASMDDSLAARIDSVDGYYADSRYDMDDPELDYRFSRRIVRFHNPRLYALASPYYWDLYYGYGAWDYLYDPYDPWYWHYGWGYGWTWGPWDCWYGGIWGWYHPYAWSYWGWGPGWSHPVHNVGYYRNVTPREFNSSRGHMAAGNRIRTNALGGRDLSSRTSALNGRNAVTNGRTSAIGTRASAQDVRSGATRGTRGTSYTDYTNARTGRSSATGEGTRTQVYNRTREGANQRSTITRGNVNQGTRSYSNQNSSSRTNTNTNTNATTRTYNNTQTTTTRTQTQTYSAPTRSSSTSSMSSGSMGGSRGGGSIGGGGGVSRGGGGGGGGRR